MIEKIKPLLAHLEAEKNIKILYAVESGSRAWGFASTDSDWDVRFIYIHYPDWYLSIDDKKDSIEKMFPDDIDVAGWEIRKALKLFRKSNPPLLEWLRSPLVYLENKSFTANLRQLSNLYFNPKSCLHHYLHMAHRNYLEYLQKDTVRIKKYFYVLRPVLACCWIEEHDIMAPVEFQELVRTQVKDAAVKKTIDNLLERKVAGEELNEEPRIEILHDFVESKIRYYLDYVKKINVPDKTDTGKLNELFRKTLKNSWT